MTSSVLPIIHSVLDADAVGECLKERFGFNGLFQCELLTRGMNDVYLIRHDGVRYAARVWRHGARTSDDVQYELEFLRHLAASGISVAASVPLPGGDLNFEVEGPEGVRPVALFNWIDGGPIANGKDPEVSARAGEILAKIHVAGLAFKPSVERIVDYGDGIRKNYHAIEAMIFDRPDLLKFFSEMKTKILAVLDSHIGVLPIGPTHGDFHSYNAFINDDDQIIFLDFDNCGVGGYAQEIMCNLWSVDKSQLGESFGSRFIEGYESVRPLVQVERDALPVLKSAKEFSYLCGAANAINAVGHSAIRWPGIDWFAKSIRRNAEASGLI
jgi:Ser/Thr protein kinase RdoA (MazF antagonist)